MMNVGAGRAAPTEAREPTIEFVKIKPLGQLLGAFKTISANHIYRTRSTPGTHVWQGNYYDHIIRNEDEFRKIWDYIDTNPQKWEEDQLHPTKFI